MTRNGKILSKHAPRKNSAIETTFMELIQELSSLTRDDSLVVAAVKSIFDSHRVRLSGSRIPVRLVTESPMRSRQKSAWSRGCLRA